MCNAHHHRARDGRPLTGKIRRSGLSTRDRLLDSVEYDTNGGCWLWTGTLNADGYGRLNVERVIHPTHRLAWREFNGSIGDKNVLHKCDVRACINPNHLFLGTQRDNVDDMLAKGRNRRGSALPASKLSEEQIPEIRRLLREGKTSYRIGPMFGVHPSTIDAIAVGRSWAHVKEAA